MPNLQKDSLAGSGKSGRNRSLIEFTLDTFSSNSQRHATCPVAIVLARKSARIWTLTSSGKLLTRLVDTDLEALAYTCLGSRSYIRGYLKLSATSNRGINVTLSYSRPTEQSLTSVSMILYLPGLAKLTGRGDQKQDLQEPPY